MLIELMMKTYTNIVVKYRFEIHALWLTTNVAIALCTARDLSRDLGVERRVYIKSGIGRFNQVLLTVVFGVASNVQVV